MYQNKLTQRYQNYVSQPVQYMNNQMLNNNPLYASNIHDQSFYQQMMLQKDEQIRKVNNISELGLTKEQITEYVIAPIKIEKSDKTEIEKLTEDLNSMMTKKFIEENWWSKRTNAPYKNILHNEDWKKDFKKEGDLIVHKVSDLDKVGLMDDYKLLTSLIEKHNGELKVIFSTSEETEHKKAFKFVQKYKYRMKYDPKDYNDLKDHYKKEQKKFDREQKHIDDIINKVMDDEIDESELKLIESEFLSPSKSKRKNKKKDNDLDKQLQELIDEYGEEILEELEEEDKNIKINIPDKRIKIKKISTNNTNNTNNLLEESKKVRIRIKPKESEPEQVQSIKRIVISKNKLNA